MQRVRPIRDFVIQLREKGEWKFFRIGTSMHALLFSRSVDHGLRIDQKYVKIEALGYNDYEVVMRDGDKTYREYMVTSLDDIKVQKLLTTLKQTLVDKKIKNVLQQE
jgi:hypothetical protein